MPVVTHLFVSAKSDGADATLVQPGDWNDGHVVSGEGFDTGTITLATAQYRVQYQHLRLTSTERLTMAGTATVFLTDLGTATGEIRGTPKRTSVSFTVPNDYVLDQLYRLQIDGAQRVSLVGTADLFLTDDFGTRSRIVLAGRGG